MKATYRASAVLCTSPGAGWERRSCLLLIFQLGNHTATLDRHVWRVSASGPGWPEGRLCPRYWVARCLCSCCSRCARPCSCRRWWSWRLSCPVARPLLSSTGRGLRQHKVSLAVLDQVGGNLVTAWDFLKDQAVNGLAEFLYVGFSIELFHGRQALDGIKGCGRHNILPGIEVRIVESLSKPRRRRQQERHQTKGLMRRTIAVHVRYKSLYISLTSFAKQ